MFAFKNSSIIDKLNSFKYDAEKLKFLSNDLVKNTTITSDVVLDILSVFGSETFQIRALRIVQTIPDIQIDTFNILTIFQSDAYKIQALRSLQMPEITTQNVVKILDTFNTDTCKIHALNILDCNSFKSHIDIISILNTFKKDSDRFQALCLFKNISTNILVLLSTFDDLYKIKILNNIPSNSFDLVSVLKLFNDDTCRIKLVQSFGHTYGTKADVFNVINTFKNDSYKLTALDYLNITNCDVPELLNLFSSDKYKVACCKIQTNINKINKNKSDSKFIKELLRCFSEKKSIIQIIDMFKIVNCNVDEIITGNLITLVESPVAVEPIVAPAPKNQTTLIIPNCIDNTTENESLQCCLCLTNENKIVLNCGHQYCRTCIDAHIKINKQCPVCCQEIVIAIRIFNSNR